MTHIFLDPLETETKRKMLSTILTVMLILITPTISVYLVHYFNSKREQNQSENNLNEKMEIQFKNENLRDVKRGSEQKHDRSSKKDPKSLHSTIEEEEYPGKGKLTKKEKSYVGLNTYPTNLGTLVEINIRQDGVYGSFLLDHPLPSHNFETHKLLEAKKYRVIINRI